MKNNNFTKVLVANRGEIAVRILKSVRDAGYRSVAVYSEADEGAPHVALADEAVCIGPAPVGESYLNPANILGAAAKTGADAIHPGYGFLSENDSFAQSCLDAGICFIGPSPEAILLMGNKRIAKQHMVDVGVPCIPGYQGEDQSDATLLIEATRVGFPLMIKAAAGGGGRGMRFLNEGDNVTEALASARSESLNAFGSDELILERAIINGRHIEIQVAADNSGQAIYLGERDCSIQRRHQKVIEEAPSPFVSEKLRALMGQAAVNVTSACHYSGVGTVEFLVDADENFYFLEMNTRLQVEHPVTELITGVDLVDWQLKIAAGEALPASQEEITLTGHAIEARFYAEDPSNNFMPQTGRIHHWEKASSAGLRFDDGITTGMEVSPHYDPMLAKIISYGDNREEARRRLLRGLSDTKLLGVRTNKTFLTQILEDNRFIEGAATTAFIDEATLEQASTNAKPDNANIALAAMLLQTQSKSNDSTLWRWSNTAAMDMALHIEGHDEKWKVSLAHENSIFHATIGEDVHTLQLHSLTGACCTYTMDGIRQKATFHIEGSEIFLDARGQLLHLDNITYAPIASDEEEGSGRITASTEGLVIQVAVAVGDVVTKGQTLVTVEAMKMEHRLAADVDGVVASVSAQVGAQVKKGQLLVDINVENSGED
ncbi:MAG: acetyl-CoA carboxylase biotin carboxylase subunit [Sneathiella sp.]